MKNISIFICLFIVLLSLPAYTADFYINSDLPTDEKIENQMVEVFNILDEAKRNNDLDLYYKACVKGYNQKKEGNPKSVKIYNDFLSAMAIEYALQRYQLTKDKKYFKRAYRWAKTAVKDKTSQIYSIRADILLASLFLNPKEMQKAYDLYRAVDIEGANDFYVEYIESYNATKNFIRYKTAARKEKWIYALKVTGLTLGAGAAGFGRGYSNYYSNQTHTHCYTIGNNLYCNSY